VKQGKPTSAFYDAPQAIRYTTEAWQRGTPMKGRPNVRELQYDVAVGIGPKGGAQYKVRVHRNERNQIHGHPAGPEDPISP
jgi:hypothetical protein